MARITYKKHAHKFLTTQDNNALTFGFRKIFISVENFSD